MYKKAAVIALNETIDLVADYMPLIANPHNANAICRQTASEIKARAITGISIAKRLLEESSPKEECEVRVISFGFGDMEPKEGKPDPFKTMLEKLSEEMQAHKAGCPRCKNVNRPQDKFCRYCGMALMQVSEKGAE